MPSPRLLLYGSGLQHLKVTCSKPGVTVRDIASAANGTHAFVTLDTSSLHSPENITITLISPAGKTHFSYDFVPRRQSQPASITPSDVIYLIMPDRFADGDPANNEPVAGAHSFDRSLPYARHGGDLRGVQQHISYLHDLGVTTLWLTPVVANDPASASDYHGYGATDYYSVDRHLGSINDLQSLVSALHAAHMRLLLDYVPNHTGPRHPWVNDPPTPTWFHGTLQHHLTSRGGFDSVVDPHALPRDSEAMRHGWFAGVLPDVNQDDPEVARYFLQNSIWWLETSGADGFRLDTFPYVERTFWSAWHRRLREFYPHLFTVGEVFDPRPQITSFFAGGQPRFDGIDSGVSSVFDFPLMAAIKQVALSGASTHELTTVLTDDWLYPHPDDLVTFIGNHDMTRITTLAGGSLAKVRVAMGLLLTLRGIPQIYSGDEIAMTGGDTDPDNRLDFPGGFPGDPANAFSATGRTPRQQEMYAFTHSLLRLRQQHPALEDGSLTELAENKTAYVFLRSASTEKLVVAVNTSSSPSDVPVSLAQTPVSNAVSLQQIFPAQQTVPVDASNVALRLPAQSVSIFMVK